MATDPRHFFNAAQVGNTNVVINLVRSGRISDLNCRDCDGRTAMMVAALNNHKNIVEFLIHYGADTEAHDNRSTALCLAAWHGHLAIVKLLVDADAVIDRAVVDGLTPLLVASVVGHVDVVSFLMERGAAFNHQCSTLETALHLAVRTNRVDVIKTLIRRGASVLVRDNNLSTPLMVACKEHNIPALTAILETLRAKGEHSTIAAVLEMPTLDDVTPLMWAAGTGFVELVRVLLDHGAALEAEDDTGATALNAAVKKNQWDSVQCMVARGANVDHADITGTTPLVVAAHRGSIAIVKLLLKANANVDARDQAGFTPLHAAASNGHYETTKLLVEDHNAALEARTVKGYTPLLHAAEHGHLRIVQFLVGRGASLDAETHLGKTPLSAACATNQGETSRFLLELAAKRGRLESLNAQDWTGRTALHWAAVKGDVATARLLVQRGADLPITDAYGLTALHMAFLCCQEETTQLLVEQNGGVPATKDDNTMWPIAAIEQLHGRPLVPGSELRQRTAQPPKWFIAPSSIRFVHGHPTYLPYAVVCGGTWIGAPVTVLRAWLPLPRRSAREALYRLQDFRRQFAVELMRWYPLNHPHLLKLYGACHLPLQMLLVTERVVGAKTLCEYVRCHPHKKWTVLYQVALAVQYLHERGLGHQRLRGDTIHVTAEGVVKLAGFGELSSFQTDEDADDIRWRSPHLLVSGAPELEDDIYSLGMCIIEAVTGEPPYAGYDPEFHKHDLKKWIIHGMPPDRSPTFCDDREWDLVTRMIAAARFHRPSITDVVRELEELVRKEDCGSQAAESVKDADALLTEARFLVNKADGDVSGVTKLDHQAFERLNNLWLSVADAPPVGAEARFRILLARLGNHLTKYQAGIDAEARRFAERQQGDAIFSLHNDIDRLARELGAAEDSPIHEWRQKWHDHCVARLTETELVNLEASADRVEVLACLYFELTRHPLSYASVQPQTIHAVCRRIKQLRDIHVADWFLPHYEINFDQKSEFNRGSFGSVHFGKWMNSRVIVKKVFEQDPAAFEREVEIWFQLYHPHVVQLFGACHLAGKQFFVCEVAKNGQLDVYLRRDDICRSRVVWQHLYEAAVALQYLHYKGILHRDLKCNNILVGSDGKTKLADFGLSSVVNNERDSKTHAKGAMRWKAPEILRGEAASPASDVYGLAMCIVEAVTGKYPWRRSDDKHNDSHRRDKSVADSDVKEFVKDGHIMQRPTSFRDAQWELVEQMTRFDASKRLPLEKVVETMRRFAQEEAAGEYDKKEPEPEQVMSPMAESESKSLVMSSSSSCRADSDSGGLFD